ncbi:MAG TPA: gamma-glutamyl-gamma-aminobutyrate hydrolase family protein [Pyrinomonadaceae bacterium]
MYAQTMLKNPEETKSISRCRPRIGITMRLEFETDRFYLSRHYSEAVEAAGGAPVHISLIPRPDYISTVMDNLDGLLLPGSDSDVDPMRYGAEPHPNLGSVHPVKDETDLLVLEEIERRGMPLFAICFGMQALNVSRGGTLIQDIASQLPKAIKHQQGAPRDRPSHAVKLDNASFLSSLAQGQLALVNSHHHQAVDKVGRDLMATAWSSDGLIEAVEDSRPQRFVVGVQWHPELGWQEDKLSQALFNHFVAAANEYPSALERETIEKAAAAAMEEDATNVIWTREKRASESR